MGPELSWLERTTDNREVGGSSPLGPTNLLKDGGIAQLGEHLPCKQGVIGSIPIISTKVRLKHFCKRMFQSDFEKDQRYLHLEN